MRCHYIVLGVDKNANDDDLKKSYRRLALQWHPDKNLENSEEATIKFREIQNAYDVLSDPQERAFYDRNRESILFGSGETQKGQIINVFDYFNTSCYAGLDDTEKGFYTIYRDVFEQITANDLIYIDDPQKITIPNFGKSDSDLADVSEFYGYWQSYCTSVSFCWEDEHDIRQASNRWVEKKIEKENKKLRDKAKRKYNEEVRSLVSFVRKRDERYAMLKKQMDEKVAENARKQAEYQDQQRAQRRQWIEETAQNQKESLDEYENQLKAMEAQFAAEWGGVSEGSEESPPSDGDGNAFSELCAEDLYCVACEKLFKTDKAFLNHEQSKKHQENLSVLKEYMQSEEAAFLNTAPSKDEPQNKSSNSKKKKKKRNQNKRLEAKETEQKLSLLKEEGELQDGFDLPSRRDNSTDGEPGFELRNAKCEEQKAVTKQKSKSKKAGGAKAVCRSNNVTSTTSENLCTTCGSVFLSKNKLFAHLKAEDHAAAREMTKTSKKSKR